MSKVRVGDIVTVRIQVTEVSDYQSKDHPDAQQILGKMLPRGGQVGWLVPQEAAFTIAEQWFKVGDIVWIDQAQSQKGEVIAYIRQTDEETAQLWVKPHGEWKAVTITVEPWLRRVD